MKTEKLFCYKRSGCNKDDQGDGFVNQSPSFTHHIIFNCNNMIPSVPIFGDP